MHEATMTEKWQQVLWTDVSKCEISEALTEGRLFIGGLEGTMQVLHGGGSGLGMHSCK